MNPIILKKMHGMNFSMVKKSMQKPLKKCMKENSENYTDQKFSKILLIMMAMDQINNCFLTHQM